MRKILVLIVSMLLFIVNVYAIDADIDIEKNIYYGVDNFSRNLFKMEFSEDERDYISTDNVIKALFDEQSIYYIKYDTKTLCKINKDKTSVVEIVNTEVIDFCLSKDNIFYTTKQNDKYKVIKINKAGENPVDIGEGYSVNEYNNNIYICYDKIFCVDYNGLNKKTVIEENFELENSDFWVQDNIIIYQSIDKIWYKQDLDGTNKFVFDYGNLMGVHQNWIYFIKIYPTNTIEIARLGRVKNDGSIVQYLGSDLADAASGNILYAKVFDKQWWLYFQWVDGMYYFPVIDLSESDSFFGFENKNDLDDSLLLLINSQMAYVNGDLTKIDKLSNEIVPFIDNGRTYLPVRFISESLGAEVIWNEKNETVEIKYNGISLIMQINSKVIKVDGQLVEIDTAPIIKNERTFLPLRALTESLGKKVEWIEEYQMVMVSNNNDTLISLKDNLYGLFSYMYNYLYDDVSIE